MTQEGYAHEPLLFYPGSGLSATERDRLERYDITISELTVDHLVFSMGRQIENNFQTFYTVAEELVGREAALGIAWEIGRRYGGQGYTKLLRAHGRERRGEPRMMALYQDLVHSIRGPKHASALFAEYDDTRCIVRRSQCIYFSEESPHNGIYTESFESGCFEGYVAADDNLLAVEVKRCRFQGAAGCEQHWVFKTPLERLGPLDADGAVDPAAPSSASG